MEAIKPPFLPTEESRHVELRQTLNKCNTSKDLRPISPLLVAARVLATYNPVGGPILVSFAARFRPLTLA